MKRLIPPKQGKSRAKGLRLIRSKGSITGVSAGLAEYFGISVRNVRIAIAAVTGFLFITGTGIFKMLGFAIYAALAAFLSKDAKKENISDKGRLLEVEEREIVESPQEEALLLCPNCNTVSKPNSVFCHACGTRL
ncbi:MAG: PspC domain-containing protein [Bacteroidota bacterium]